MTIHSTDPNDYAHNLEGVGLYALAMYDYWKQSPVPEQYDHGLRNGNLQAYAAIIKHVTGLRPDDPRVTERLEPHGRAIPIRGTVRADMIASQTADQAPAFIRKIME